MLKALPLHLNLSSLALFIAIWSSTAWMSESILLFPPWKLRIGIILKSTYRRLLVYSYQMLILSLHLLARSTS